MKNIARILISSALLALSFICHGNGPIDTRWLEANYTKREVMVEMRDGIKLYTAIYEPVTKKKRPVLMVRTPYSCSPYGNGWASDLTGMREQFVRNEYIIVFQNVRGRFQSEGAFENVRPYNPHKTATETDEASDAYDTIEWLLKNTRSNGKIGITGMSYPGFYATMSALSGHPALKAVSPQAPILDWYKGDDVHHNGALMLTDSYSFGQYMFKRHDNPTVKEHRLPYPVKGNSYDWFLEHKDGTTLTAALADTMKFWNEIMSHPHYDSFWQERSLEQHLQDVKPAILVTGGSFDTDDCYGAVNTYRLIRDNSTNGSVHFAYGPWCHGCWHSTTYKGLGQADFGSGTGEYFMKNIEYPFFRHYLEGKGEKPEPVYIRMSGDSLWHTSESWPFPGTEYIPAYLNRNGMLSLDMPSDSCSSSAYVSDPAAPVPFMQDASKRDRAYMAADQSFASYRNDVLTFTSACLPVPVMLGGPIRAELELSLGTTDADIIVKLIDVHPDGYQMLLRADVFPIRYRHSISSPEPATPGEITHVSFTMNDIAHKIHPGHRLMVQIQSSWFPLVYMNPQTFMPNIYEAVDGDYVKSEVTIYHQAGNASRIILPVVRQ